MNSQTLYEELFAYLSEKLEILPDKPDETPGNTLLALWHTAAKQPNSARMASETALPSLDEKSIPLLHSLIDRRLKGEPLAHLTGREHFMGIELFAGPEALVPRRETELLGYAALELLHELVKQSAVHDAAGAGETEPHKNQGKKIIVLDLCTGGGNLAVALAYHQPAAKVYASDLSAAAIQLASRNVEQLGLQQRVQLRQSDLLNAFEDEPFYGTVDLMTCNPPYISSKKVDHMPNEIAKFEPRLAFDGGPLGVNLLQRLMRQAPRFLHPGGWLAFEVGLGQGAAIARKLRNDHVFSEVRTVNDHNGEIRAILARKGHETSSCRDGDRHVSAI